MTAPASLDELLAAMQAGGELERLLGAMTEAETHGVMLLKAPRTNHWALLWMQNIDEIKGHGATPLEAARACWEAGK